MRIVHTWKPKIQGSAIAANTALEEKELSKIFVQKKTFQRLLLQISKVVRLAVFI